MVQFNLENAIINWKKQLRKFQAFNHGSKREIEVHLRDYIDDLIAQGLDEQSAFEKAVLDFGEIPAMATEEYWNQKRKTTFNSVINKAMITTYFKVAIRNFWKHKFYASLNIVGLTIGLAIVFFIGLFVQDELSFDQFHAKKDVLYRVVENQYYADQPVFPVAVTPTALSPSLESNFPEIVASTRVSYENMRFGLGEKIISENNGIMVDEQFFDLFTYPILSGSINSFKNDLNALILTEELVTKYFPDEDPINKSIRLDDEEYIVRAVIANTPKNSHLPFRYILNFEKFLAGDSSRATNWGSNWIYTYVELDASADLNTVNDKIKGHIKENNENSVTDIYLQPLSKVYLGSVNFVVEAKRKGEMLYVRIFSIVAIFILIISCINFMNLSTARSEKRAKEVGLRKTVGASRSQLIFQFLTESVLLTLFAVFIAVILVLLLLPFFNQITGKEFSLQTFIDPLIGLELSIGILAVALLTGLFAGAYPAFFISSVNPVLAVKGQSFSGKGGSNLRKTLVVLQFGISVVLIVGTLVVYQQLNYIQDVNLGYNRKNIAYTSAPSNKVDVFAEEIRKMSGVEGVGLSNRHPGYVLSSTSGFSWQGKNDDESILLHFMSVDEYYMSTMEMSLEEGRGFENSDSAVVIINQTAKEMMGMNEPVGQVLTNGDQNYSIVGVVNNFNFKSIHTTIEPLLIFKEASPNRVYIRYAAGSESDLKEKVESVWASFFPDRELSFHFLDSDFNQMYEAEQRTSKLSGYFAVIAIAISCLGLFGLVTFATEQRSKEIGIRKVLGASVPGLFVHLVMDFTKLIIVALIISIPIGWYAMDQWLTNYAYRIELSSWTFVLAGAIVLLIGILTVSYQSIKVSMGNPVNALRSD